MQHSRPPGFPPLFPSFQRHRSSIDQSKFRIDLVLPKPIVTPVWASLPTPPMSGSPPPERPPEPPLIAGRRRKRSETPPTTIPPVTTSPETQLGERTGTSIARARTDRRGSEVPLQAPPPYSSSYPPAPPHGSYGEGSSMGAITATQIEPRFSLGAVSPRTTRKAKAHVASACVNCKKKHLRCDTARPCHRCVQSGKEDTCIDVEHKKRGRPPLRPDDPSSRRSYDTSSGLLSGHSSDFTRRMTSTDTTAFGQMGGFGRHFRPLQAQPTYDPNRAHWRPGAAYPTYGAPTISPSQASAIGTFIPSSQGYGSGHGMGMTQSPSAYMHHAASYPTAGYSFYQPSQPDMGYGASQHYANPIFPRSQLPHPQPEVTMGMAGPSSLQLPPIRPAAERTSIDPALAQQHPSGASPQDPRMLGSTRQPDPKRPKMDIQGILGPRND